MAPIAAPGALKMPVSLPSVAPKTGAQAPQAAYWKNIMAPRSTRVRKFLDIQKDSLVRFALV